jgi:arylformamidase
MLSWEADVAPSLEGVDLRSVGTGWYELACLPLRLVGSDGAPARVILRVP